MVLPNRVQDLLNLLYWSSRFLFQVWPLIYVSLVNLYFSHSFNIELGGLNPFRLKEVNILLLCQNHFEAQMFLLALLLGDEGASMNSWEFIIGNIKFKFFYIGQPWIARRVWRDYGKMDAVVYIVDADAMIRGHAVPWPREDLIDLYDDEAFEEAPFLIFGSRLFGDFLNTIERLRYLLLRGFLG